MLSIVGKHAYASLCDTVKRLSAENQVLKAANDEMNEALKHVDVEVSAEAKRLSKLIAQYDRENIALQREVDELRKANMTLSARVLAFEIKFKNIRKALTE